MPAVSHALTLLTQRSAGNKKGAYRRLDELLRVLAGAVLVLYLG
ncbi:hypothetical protein SB30_230139 [Klebsiella quasipneumoniae subsp. similipneumoniae]|nr:hypothetical protein SB30_230139 [Klebsiella quasipneumoniae subsp. similipneumoniae]